MFFDGFLPERLLDFVLSRILIDPEGLVKFSVVDGLPLSAVSAHLFELLKARKTSASEEHID